MTDPLYLAWGRCFEPVMHLLVSELGGLVKPEACQRLAGVERSDTPENSPRVPRPRQGS